MEKIKKRTVRKKTSAVVSVVLIVALLLTGTFAWYVTRKALNEFSNNNDKPCGQDDALLHDDFEEGINKDVYVENTNTDPDAAIYVRIKLQEFMDLTSDKRPADIDSRWITHTPVMCDDGCLRHDDCEKANEAGALFHSNFEWVWGGTKVYKTGQGVYKDPTTGATYEFARDNKNDYALNPPETKLTLGGADHASPVGDDGNSFNVVSLDWYLTWPEDVRENYEGWIYDTNGWAYWSQPLYGGTATGLLLDNVIISDAIKDATYYYAINVLMEAVNKEDIGMWTNGDASVDDPSKSTEKATDPMVPIIEDIVGREKGSSAASLTINSPKTNMTLGDTQTLSITQQPAGANDPVSISSNHNSVIKVLEDGTLEAVGVGTATITVSVGSGEGDRTKTFDINVSAAPIPATGVTISGAPPSAIADNSAPVQLSASLTPATSTETAAYSWSTSNSAVATVDSTGKITPVGEGTATITVTATVGGKTFTDSITVTVSGTSLPLFEGKTTFNPVESDDPDISTWAKVVAYGTQTMWLFADEGSMIGDQQPGREVESYCSFDISEVLDMTKITNLAGLTVTPTDEKYAGSVYFGADKFGNDALICTFLPTYEQFREATAAKQILIVPIEVKLELGSKSATITLNSIYDGSMQFS